MGCSSVPKSGIPADDAFEIKRVKYCKLDIEQTKKAKELKKNSEAIAQKMMGAMLSGNAGGMKKIEEMMKSVERAMQLGLECENAYKELKNEYETQKSEDKLGEFKVQKENEMKRIDKKREEDSKNSLEDMKKQLGGLGGLGGLGNM